MMMMVRMINKSDNSVDNDDNDDVNENIYLPRNPCTLCNTV